MADDQLHPFLLIECPRLLFPFVRRIISDVTRDGGFPPLNVDTVDFLALYRQELPRRAEAQKPPADSLTAQPRFSQIAASPSSATKAAWAAASSSVIRGGKGDRARRGPPVGVAAAPCVGRASRALPSTRSGCRPPISSR